MIKKDSSNNDFINIEKRLSKYLTQRSLASKMAKLLWTVRPVNNSSGFRILGSFNVGNYEISATINDGMGSFSQGDNISICFDYIDSFNELVDEIEHELIHSNYSEAQSGGSLDMFCKSEIIPYAVSLYRVIKSNSGLQKLPLDKMIRKGFSLIIKKGMMKPPKKFIDNVIRYLS